MTATRAPFLKTIMPYKEPEELSFYCASTMVSTHRVTSYQKTNGSLFYIAEYLYGTPATMWCEQDMIIACAYLNTKNLEMYFQLPDNRFEKIVYERKLSAL